MELPEHRDKAIAAETIFKRLGMEQAAAAAQVLPVQRQHPINQVLEGQALLRQSPELP